VPFAEQGAHLRMNQCPVKRQRGSRRALLLLRVADRVDAAGSTLRSSLSLHPDNPITETGVLSEFHRHGLSSRFGRKRADVTHRSLDLIVVGAPWVVAAGIAYLLLGRVARHRA
jgi:hypothetical protein